MVSMPSNIFATTGTSVSIIFIDKSRNDEDEILLIDATKMGKKVSLEDGQRTILSAEDEQYIINTFNNKILVEDFSVLISKKQVQERNYSFSAGQYFEVKMEFIELTQEEFEQKITAFSLKLEKLFLEGRSLEYDIKQRLGELKYE